VNPERKLQWVGYAINLAGATLMLVAVFQNSWPNRRWIAILAACLVLAGSTVKLIYGLRERKTKVLAYNHTVLGATEMEHK
jgi:hypothetical protein